jgi:hypothetical protein
VLVWDDHEVHNDYAGDQSERFDPPAAFRRRRAAAYRADWEHLPLRRGSRPRGPAARRYRRLRFGDLAELAVLDTRQYRHDQPCHSNGVGRDQVVAGCRERLDPRRTLLGTQQRRWLLAGLDHSHARWNVIAQQLLMAELDRQPGSGLAYSSDGWDGYAADRARILGFLAARRPSNPVVLGGDLHCFWVTDLKLDHHQPATATPASEFVGTSVSSSGPPYEVFGACLPDNPHVRFFDSRWRGYLRCLADHRRWTTDLRVVSTVERPVAPVRTLASFVVRNGRQAPSAPEPDAAGPRAAEQLLHELVPLDDERRAEAEVWLAFTARALVDPRQRAIHERIHDDLNRACTWAITLLVDAGLTAEGLDVALEASRLHALLDGLALHAVMRPTKVSPSQIIAVLARHLDALQASQSQLLAADFQAAGELGVAEAASRQPSA